MNAGTASAFPGLAGGQTGFQTWGGSQAQNPYPGGQDPESPWAIPPPTNMTYPSSAHASPWQPVGHTPTSTPAQYPAAFGIAHSSSAPAGQQQWMTGQFGEELITPPDSPHIGFGNPGPAFGGGEPIIAGGFGPSPAHQGAFPTVGLPIANDERLSRSRSERRRRRSGEMAYAPARSKSRHRSEEFPHITRSLSYGGGQQVYQNFRSASQSKKIPRPRDWRANYKTSPLAFLNPTSNSKTFSIVQEFRDDQNRQLNPLFEYVSRAPSIDLDLRHDPLVDQNSFPLLGHAPTQMDLFQYATNPPARHMRLFHKDFPWYIDIVGGNYGVVTAGDLLYQMYNQLQQGITDAHYYTEAITDADRGQIQAAFAQRVGGDMGQHAVGVLRVDFLGVKFMFRGLVRKNGMWEMKLNQL